MRTHVPLVNVIVPAFNCGAYIGEALESVFSQTLADVEPIVVDDGSTDDTRAVVERFGRRVHYVHQANQGPGKARNVALAAATAPFLAFMDADDVWERDHLRANHQVLDADADLGGVFSDFSIFDRTGTLVARGNREMFPYFKRTGRDIDQVFEWRGTATLLDGTVAPVYKGRIFETLFEGNFVLPTSMLVRREAALATGEFRVDLRTQQDYDYFLRFSKRFRLGYVDAPLVRYRRHAQQLTDPSRMELILLAVNRVIDQYEVELSDGHDRRRFQRRKAMLMAELGKVYLGQGRTRDARNALAESLRRAPLQAPACMPLLLSLVPTTWLNRLRRIRRQARQRPT